AVAYEQNQEKVGPWKNKADEVKKRSDELYEYLNDCKNEIVSVNDPDAIIDGKVEMELVRVKDNNNTPAEIMILNKRGEELKGKVNDYREYLLSLIEDKEKYKTIVESIEGNLNTHDPTPTKEGETHTWESEHFEHLPLAAVITILSKMQGDVRNTESEIINFLLNQVDAGDFKVNVLEAVVISNSNYVFKGQEYKAQVFLAAYDSTKMPQVILDNGTVLEVEKGKGVFKSVSTTTGPRKWGGKITLDNDGNVIEKTFSAEYQVAEASAVVSPTKMNVFYRGVENPVSVSASGVPESDIKPRISYGTITKVSAGSYIVKPGPRESASTVSVYADIEGQQKFMGEMNFRVMNLPTPFARVEGVKTGTGSLSMGDLSRLNEVTAELDDFLFDVKYTVTEFTVSAALSGGFTRVEKSDSDKFTSGQKEIFRSLRTGQRVYIESIKAIGPDGVPQDLNPIIIKVK
ncbi:MAG: gliding motility protein GldM, partial [Bacteroidota bacterium]